MNPQMEIGTDEKALHINLDSTKYGTFAEIGAGQEVARRFFRVGGAAGTIAKTMSAYDMTFSDAIYGPADRYVSRVRLQTMLDHEFDLLIERSKHRATRSPRGHRVESSPRRLLLSAAGKTDCITSGKSSTGTNRSGHDQIFRASLSKR
jgi:hypothetical protein